MSSPTSEQEFAAQVTEKLRKLLIEAGCTVRKGLEMRFALLLLITLFRQLSDDMMHEQEALLKEIRNTIVDKKPSNTVRYWTGRTVSDIIRAAPWSLEMQDPDNSSDTVRALNGIFAGMVEFVRELMKELKDHEQNGINLVHFDVDENFSAEDGNFAPEHPLSKKSTSAKRKRNPDDGTSGGQGSQRFGSSRVWSTGESIALLRTWRNNGSVPHIQKARLHNENWRPVDNPRERSKEGVVQQMSKLTGLAAQGLHDRIDAKIAELEQGLTNTKMHGYELLPLSTENNPCFCPDQSSPA